MTRGSTIDPHDQDRRDLEIMRLRCEGIKPAEIPGLLLAKRFTNQRMPEVGVRVVSNRIKAADIEHSQPNELLHDIKACYW